MKNYCRRYERRKKMKNKTKMCIYGIWIGEDKKETNTCNEKAIKVEMKKYELFWFSSSETENENENGR